MYKFGLLLNLVETSIEEARDKIAHCFRRLREIDANNRRKKAVKRSERDTADSGQDGSSNNDNSNKTSEEDGTKRSKPMAS